VNHLASIRFEPPPENQAGSYPFSVAAIAALAGSELALDRDVTFLIGENGSGKSTLLEALACAAGSVAVASDPLERDVTLNEARLLADTMRLSWRRRTRAGFFMRSEDFFGFTKYLRQLKQRLQADLEAVDEIYAESSEYARGLGRSPFLKELAAMRSMYGDDLDAYSHGESYFTLFRARFKPKGLYLLDEPEAPLSPLRQIALLSMLKGMVDEQGAQFIIATHSPILMAYPGAAIHSFDGGAFRPIDYADVEHVSVTRAFLQNPERFLRHL
jgi:predicted ATPase